MWGHGSTVRTENQVGLISEPPGGSDGKESVCNVGDPSSIPGLERSPEEGNGNPLQYTCLENPLDRGAWGATVRRVTKSQTWLSNSNFTFTWTNFKSCLSKPLQCVPIWQQCWVWLRAIIDVGRVRRRESFSIGDLRALTGSLLVRIQAFVAMAQAQSPVRELIFYMPCGMTKENKKEREKTH